MTDEENVSLENAMTAPGDTPASSGDEELPERYRGKSASELAKMHEEAERKIGDQGRQIGEYKTAYEQAQSDLAYSRQAPPTPQAPPPVENLDEEFFASPTKAIDSYFEKKLREYDSHKRYTDGAREFTKTLAELKRQEPDIFGDEDIVNRTRQFVEYGLKSGKLDPMIQADPNLLTAIGVNVKYQRDKANPSRNPVQPTATESPSAVRTNEPVAKNVQFSGKGQDFIDYFKDVEGSGMKSEKDAAELLAEEESET